MVTMMMMLRQGRSVLGRRLTVGGRKMGIRMRRLLWEMWVRHRSLMPYVRHALVLVLRPIHFLQRKQILLCNKMMLVLCLGVLRLRVF